MLLLTLLHSKNPCPQAGLGCSSLAFTGISSAYEHPALSSSKEEGDGCELEALAVGGRKLQGVGGSLLAPGCSGGEVLAGVELAEHKLCSVCFPDWALD